VILCVHGRKSTPSQIGLDSPRAHTDLIVNGETYMSLAAGRTIEILVTKALRARNAYDCMVSFDMKHQLIALEPDSVLRGDTEFKN